MPWRRKKLPDHVKQMDAEQRQQYKRLPPGHREQVDEFAANLAEIVARGGAPLSPGGAEVEPGDRVRVFGGDSGSARSRRRDRVSPSPPPDSRSARLQSSDRHNDE